MSDTPIVDANVYTSEDVVSADLARRLERDRAELIEALCYWLPDETMLPPSCDAIGLADIKKWQEHAALLARLEKDKP